MSRAKVAERQWETPKQAKRKKESILGGENETDNGMETEVMIGFSEIDSTSDFMMMELKVGNKISRLLNWLKSYRASLWSLDIY